MQENTNDFKFTKCVYLDYDIYIIQYADMIHLSEQVHLADLETLQVIVKSN